MKVFEFHFNPRGTETKVFETFVYEPETAAEEKQGYLYMAGALNNLLPQNNKLLDSLAGIIKREYYGKPASLQENLEKVNEFLAAEVKKENVSWLGNLNFAIFSLSAETPEQDWQELNFTKTGDIKMMLVRGSEIVDIGSSLDTESSHSSKIFQNASSGKLLSGDKIMILSYDIFNFFVSKNLIRRTALATTEKELKQILNSYRKELAQISGFCLFIILQRSRFSLLKKIKKPKLGFVLIPFKFIGKLFSLFKKPKFKPLPKIKPKFVNPFSGIKSWFKKSPPRLSRIEIAPARTHWTQKNLYVIILLIFVLAIGFFIFFPEKKAEIVQVEQVLAQARFKTVQAENLLDLGEEKEANLLLQEAYQELISLGAGRIPLQKDVQVLKKSIKESLFVINKLETNPSLELLFEFNHSQVDFVPQEMMIFNSQLYLYNPFSPQLYWFDPVEKNSQFITAKQNLKLGSAANSIQLFTTPNILYSFQENELLETELELPYTDFNFDLLAGFKNNVYFLDKNTGEIARYANQGKDSPLLWLRDGVERENYNGAASMVVDGGIWVLNKNNINRYYAGSLEKTLEIDIFPALQNLTKIWTSSAHLYLYLFESTQNRMIILNREGKIVKQFQSEELDNLKDFSVSADGQTIYLLNGFKIYQIEI